MNFLWPVRAAGACTPGHCTAHDRAAAASATTTALPASPLQDVVNPMPPCPRAYFQLGFYLAVESLPCAAVLLCMRSSRSGAAALTARSPVLGRTLLGEYTRGSQVRTTGLTPTFDNTRSCACPGACTCASEGSGGESSSGSCRSSSGGFRSGSKASAVRASDLLNPVECDAQAHAAPTRKPGASQSVTLQVQQRSGAAHLASGQFSRLASQQLLRNAARAGRQAGAARGAAAGEAAAWMQSSRVDSLSAAGLMPPSSAHRADER